MPNLTFITPTWEKVHASNLKALKAYILHVQDNGVFGTNELEHRCFAKTLFDVKAKCAQMEIKVAIVVKPET